MKKITEKTWTTKAGFDAEVVYIMYSHHRCGYVGVNKDHFLFGVYIENIENIFDVHGGITFSGPKFQNVRVTDNDLWWWGFDCAHAQDKTDFNPNGIERTLEFCEKECEDLANQIKSLNNTTLEYYLSYKKHGKLKEESHNKMLIEALSGDIYAKKYFELLKNNT
jgi:hypothetical protein